MWACSECRGFGRVLTLEPFRRAPFSGEVYSESLRDLQRAETMRVSLILQNIKITVANGMALVASLAIFQNARPRISFEIS